MVQWLQRKFIFIVTIYSNTTKTFTLWPRNDLEISRNVGSTKEYANHQTTGLISHSSSLQFSSVAQSCPTLCHPTDCSTPGRPVHHQLPEFIQTHINWVSDAIQPSHPLSSSSPPALNLSQSVSFQMSQLFTSGGQSIGVAALASSEYSGLISLRMDWFDLLAILGTLKSP